LLPNENILKSIVNPIHSAGISGLKSITYEGFVFNCLSSLIYRRLDRFLGNVNTKPAGVAVML
jgi:hypothetical protein